LSWNFGGLNNAKTIDTMHKKGKINERLILNPLLILSIDNAERRIVLIINITSIDNQLNDE
jgi:hypothetical protein